MASPQVPMRMRAAQIIEANKPYKVNEVDVPRPEDLHPQDVLVKTAVASLCHTDGMVVQGVFGTNFPQTASHEGAGTVVAIGKDVQTFKVGDRVMCGLQTHRCGDCVSCHGKETEKQYCPGAATRAPGIGRDGTFAEYLTADAKESNKIPDSVTFGTAAPLACAGRTVFRGVIQARLQKGQTLGVVGSGGGLGHLGIQFAHAYGLKVIGVDARDEGLALSKDCGAELVLDARKGKDEIVRQAMEFTGEGCDATINVSDADDAAAISCAITRMHGTVIQMAQPENVSVPFQEIIFRNIKIEGSLICSAEQGDQMLEIVSKAGISVRKHELRGLDRVNELVDLSHSGKLSGKGIIIIDEEAIERERELGAKF